MLIDLKDEELILGLTNEYGLKVEKITFLPIGADFSSTVYQITTSDKRDYFLKLRRGEFIEASVSVPQFLADAGIKQIIPPLKSKTNKLWLNLAATKAILYPFVDGQNAVEAKLSDRQWIEFGETIKRFHSLKIPTTDVPQESFSPKWREIVKIFLERINNKVFLEPVAAKTALFLKSKSSQIVELVERAEKLASELQKQPLEYILCHADIHGWNLLIDKENALYIVDWDTLIFAPKERDLMFIGAGIWDSGRTSTAEESLFYQGYGQTEVNQSALFYYRCERIIQDIGEYCEHIFLSDAGDEDRIQSFEYLQSIFRAQGAVEACQQIHVPPR